MKNVVVIGGGIIGLSAAFYLQQSGHKVTVIDKGNFSDNCSYGNAGYVCPSHFIPLATPGIVWQGLKWMLNSRSPFYVKPSLNGALIDWGLKFIRSANAKHVAQSAVPLRDIALFSQKEYTAWTGIPGFDFSYEHKGVLEIFQTEKVKEHSHHTVAQGKELGLDVDLLDAQQLQSLEPHTKINALGAIYFKCDAHLDPNKLMRVLSNHLKQNGVRFIGEEVSHFETQNGVVKKVITKSNAYEADEVVIATGSWSREVAALLDVKIPLMPGRGYSVTLENSPYHLNHPAIFAEGRAAATPMLGNKIRFGGTMEVVSTKTPPRYQRVEGILQAVKRFLPEFDIPMPSTDKIWYGYRPCSADGLPYIGRISKFNNVVVGTGHSMLGLSLGPATGKLLCELIDEKKTSVDLSAFAVERFGK